jgi:hypothetical protein
MWEGGWIRLPIGLAVALMASILIIACGSDSASVAIHEGPADQSAQGAPRAFTDHSQAPHRGEPLSKPRKEQKTKRTANAGSQAGADGKPSTPKTGYNLNDCTRQFSQQQCTEIAEKISKRSDSDGQSAPSDHCPPNLSSSRCAELSTPGDREDDVETTLPSECPPTWPKSQCQQVEEAFGESVR